MARRRGIAKAPIRPQEVLTTGALAANWAYDPDVHSVRNDSSAPRRATRVIQHSMHGLPDVVSSQPCSSLPRAIRPIWGDICYLLFLAACMACHYFVLTTPRYRAEFSAFVFLWFFTAVLCMFHTDSTPMTRRDICYCFIHCAIMIYCASVAICWELFHWSHPGPILFSLFIWLAFFFIMTIKRSFIIALGFFVLFTCFASFSFVTYPAGFLGYFDDIKLLANWLY